MRSAVERAFAGGAGTHRMGAELELFVLAGTPSLSPHFVTTTEPGGQLELNLPPAASTSQLLAEFDTAIAELSASAEIALTGTDPVHDLDDVPLALQSPRYLAMQEIFDRRGDAGRRMMRLTASLQLCVDLLPGAAGREQWLVANLAGPALVAAFGGSPERTQIWLGIDPERTAYDGRHLDVQDAVGAYLAFAQAAERFPIPETEDDSYHLSTLFPPVRPRGGYLELRYLDSQLPTAELLDTVWTLMYDETARRSALELLLPTLPDLWSRWTTADPTELLELTVPEEVAA